MALRDLLTLRPQGLYCPAGDFFIDPVRPVGRALITHGHADHARKGHGRVLATAATLDIMAVRYGESFCAARQAVEHGEAIRLGDVRVRFHPAGHILGSAQIALEAGAATGGGRIVISGDYKRSADPTCAPFEPIACDIFITEATFALPVFRQPDPAGEIARLLRSTEIFPERAHLVGCYSLGKTQRVAALLRAAGYDRPIHVHGAAMKLMEVYEAHGVDLGPLAPVAAADKAGLGGQIVLCPPSALGDGWARGFREPLTALASGWMRLRAHARRRGVELPLAISDHADWDELTATIRQTGCEEVWITHGETQALCRWAELAQLRAQPLDMIGYGDEDADS